MQVYSCILLNTNNLATQAKSHSIGAALNFVVVELAFTISIVSNLIAHHIDPI
jgi:hypothetical protein